MPHRILLFNHKGGVGKTTSAYNIGWKLSQKGLRVLLVDGDSQVNLTARALGAEFEDYYGEASRTRLNNIYDAVRPVFEGRPQPIEAFACPTAENNKKLYLLPGHPDLSALEGQISLAQETRGTLSVTKNIPGALNRVISLIEKKYKIDYSVVDINPGLGALNQNFRYYLADSTGPMPRQGVIVDGSVMESFYGREPLPQRPEATPRRILGAAERHPGEDDRARSR